MKKNFDIRLAALREYLRTLSADETVFIVEGGGEFRTAEDAFTYLRKYGAVTPDGKRIVLYPHPVEGVDPLSLSLYQMIDEAIEQGKLKLPELESDEIGGRNLEEMTADNGEFLRVLSGNLLSDLDGLIKYEMGRMHEQH